ncbi:MAG: hypothetical protein IJZ73_03390 [Clostridia bacterium]|nr:hypothetical protein [Clostridia bacterium]
MISEDKKREYVKRLILARMHLLSTHGFFGLLLMHANFSLDTTIGTAATDGEKIYFCPAFMDELSDSELEFVLMHEVMHMALGHCIRGVNKDPQAYNIACDIVINSNILKENNCDKSSITLSKYGESMHLTPSGDEGYNFTAEQVYEMLPKLNPNKAKGSIGVPGKKGKPIWDDHSKWKDGDDLTEEEREKQAEWNKRLKDACKAIEIRKASTNVGNIPLLAERRLNELTQSQMDWREVLADFIDEEIGDYSFSPPDKRYLDSPFYLPDFNEMVDMGVKNILFVIDTSGSMNDNLVTLAYSEVKGAIDQFDGKLQGLLGFFEIKVVPPVPFYDEDSFMIIKPKGGGGTSFSCVFDYVSKNMKSELPTSIIILTDGYAEFPPEKVAMGIPVLWVINNEDVTPPWGKVARIKG